MLWIWKSFLKIIKNYNVIFTESYLDFSSLFKICKKINQFPRFHYEFQKKILSNTILKDRENLKLNIDSNNEFENLIKNLFFKYLPKSYLESFSNILLYGIKNNIKCKKICTAIGHLHNDTFNIWSAYKVKNGTKLYVSQHGGSLRPKTTGDFDHQIKISDKFITWHKEYNSKHIRLTPNKLIRIKNNSYKYKKNKFLTIIGFEAFMYTHRAQSTLPGACMPIEFADCVEIYTKLKSSIKKNVKYRYADYSENEGWFNTKQRLKDKFGKNVICQSKSMLDSFKKSKMLICKYPQTTFAEAMISNIPTILVLNKNYWHFDSNFLKVIEELKNTKIIFEEVKNATDHVNFYWNNLDEWWLSKKTLKAREDFFDMCCKHSNNWAEDWKNFLIS